MRTKGSLTIAHVASIALMCATANIGATPLWQNDWLISSPITLQNGTQDLPGGKPSQMIAFGADDERVIAAPSPNMPQYQIMRLKADGSPRWSAGIHDYDRLAQPYALRALPDGGALVALGYPGSERYTDAILRYTADGGVAWSRKYPTGWLARVSPTRTASAGCSRLTVFDDADGQVAWQRVLANTESCSVGGLASDASGHLYASLQRTTNFSIIGYRIEAFDPQGTRVWQVEIDDATGGDLIGVAGPLLYVQGSGELRAMRLVDGSLAWSAPIAQQARVLFSGDGADEALVIGGATVKRLAGDTGMPRWNIAFTGDVATTNVVGDALLVAGADGSRARIDTADGSVTWSVSGGGVRWFAFGELASGALQGLAQLHDPGPGASPAALHVIDSASGAVTQSMALPPIPQGFTVADTLAGADVISSGVSQQEDFPRFHLRRVDGATGATTWEREEPIDEFGTGLHFVLPRASVVARDARIVASMAISGEFNCDAAGGWARITSYRVVDGGREWVAALRDTDQRCTRVSPPALDADGNVFLSVASLVPCEDGTLMGCQRRTLYKLAAADGSIAWRVDEEFDAGGGGFVLMPSPLYVFGADVVVPGAFIGPPASMRRHAGADGSVLWSSTEFAASIGFNAPEIEVLDEHRLVLHEPASIPGNFRWAALDTDDGSTLWSSEAPAFPAGCTPSPSCTLGFGGESRLLPDGNLLDPYQQDYAPWFARWHYDGSGQIDHWLAAPGSPITSSAIAWLSPDTTHATLLRRHRGTGGSIQLLAGIDASNDLLQAERALYGYHLGLLEYHAFRRPLSLPTVDRLLATTHRVLPSQPVAHGVTLLDTSITASGNLSIDASLETNRMGPGDSIGFEVNVGYEGDAPVEGAALQLRLPWAGGVRDATCETFGAASCALDLSAGQVNATIDTAAGGGATVRGVVDVLVAEEALAVTAMVTGPVGLAEADTLDNFDRIEIRQSLFRNGFDAGN